MRDPEGSIVGRQRVLDGRYEVGELIGRGGMADVHLGRDVRLGRAVAIKVLRADLARDPLFQSRFRREAQAVAALNHPAIVSIFDTGEEQPGDGAPDDLQVPFIVMEYLAGRTLRDLLKAGDLDISTSIRHMTGVLSALDYSHRSGIVHRDIKPANVMITPDGAVKVMDFGIARAIADSAATMTQTQAVIGTAQYLSPEQARGENVDARSDLYSAGCLLYELLAGRPPFTGDSPVSVAYQHVREEPPPASTFNPEVSPALDSVLAVALAKDRGDRFQSAAAFREALLRAESGQAVEPVRSDDATEAFAVLPAARLAMPEGDDGPPTRAMAKVLAGGSLAEASSDDGQADGMLPTPLAIGNSAAEDSRRRASRRAWMTVFVITVVGLLAAAAYFAFTMMNQPEKPAPTIDVPAVAGLPRDEATDRVYREGLRPAVETVFHPKVDAGLVIGTDPAAGTAVPPDSSVTLRVSKGPANIKIRKSIIGMTESSARDALESVNLHGGKVTEANSATMPAGRVLATDPAVGDTVPAGSAVDLILSTGKVTVPGLTGLPLEEAATLLEDPSRQLPYTVENEETSEAEPGTVIAQSAEPGTDVDQGTEIVLTVAEKPTGGPAPEPSKPGKDTNGRGKPESEGPLDPVLSG
jgi:beta-lactam-binding protein with PASTA domain